MGFVYICKLLNINSIITAFVSIQWMHRYVIFKFAGLLGVYRILWTNKINEIENCTKIMVKWISWQYESIKNGLKNAEIKDPIHQYCQHILIDAKAMH